MSALEYRPPMSTTSYLVDLYREACPRRAIPSTRIHLYSHQNSHQFFGARDTTIMRQEESNQAPNGCRHPTRFRDSTGCFLRVGMSRALLAARHSSREPESAAVSRYRWLRTCHGMSVGICCRECARHQTHSREPCQSRKGALYIFLPLQINLCVVQARMRASVVREQILPGILNRLFSVELHIDHV
jgi:hypothetical protein